MIISTTVRDRPGDLKVDKVSLNITVKKQAHEAK